MASNKITELLEKQKREIEKKNLQTAIQYHCWTCGTHEKVSTCSVCKVAIYCGPECQTRDWSRHKLECKCGLVEWTKFTRVEPVLSARKRLVDNKIGIFASRPIVAAEQLINDGLQIEVNRNNITPKNVLRIFQGKEIPSYLFFLNHDTSLPDGKSRMFDIIQNNGFIQESGSGKYAYYFMAGLFKHSCRPNCSIVHIKVKDEKNGIDVDCARIVALRDIDANEELTVSYHSSALWADYETRQALLKKHYGWDCQCEACQEGPDTEDNKLRKEAIVIYDSIQALVSNQAVYELPVDFQDIVNKVYNTIAPALYPGKLNPVSMRLRSLECLIRSILRQPDREVHIKAYHDYMLIEEAAGQESNKLYQLFKRTFGEVPPPLPLPQAQA